MIMFIAVGGTALHYWHGYLAERKYIHVATERQVKFGLNNLNYQFQSYLLNFFVKILFKGKVKYFYYGTEY